ncbi:NADPH:quinone oxidoreductase family protein [Rhodobacteraceae bacterium CCMM004]|nr:NADPH:quinone oxidoreductase family protein [Rhodobacteraceae bacterium CCMM004]
MKAYQIIALGQEPVLREVPDPIPAPGEVAVRIAAAGLNFADLLMVRGQYQERPDLPATLGLELAGIVEKTADDVTSFRSGDRVAVFSGQGGLAERGCFPADRCVALPDAMPFDVAAGFLIAYGTSHLALTRAARLAEGETLVVLGAAGGVGLTAVEIGHRLGARVVAVARGAEKLAVAEAAGATHLIDSEREDLRAALKALGGADVVYDAVGGRASEAAMRACRPEARVLLIGFASGDVPEVRANHLLVKNVSVHGFYWGGFMRFAPQAVAGSLRTLFDWYAAGQLTPHVSHRLPLSRTAEGLDLLRSRRATGKVVIVMDGADQSAP